MPVRILLLLLFTLYPSPLTTHAQVPDTTRAGTLAPASVDTVRLLVDTLSQPVGFFGPDPGAVVQDVLPVRLPALDAAYLLAELPGTFLYDFGTPGWPNGWSPYGFAPHTASLLLEGRPYDDLLTGQPRYDLLPYAWLTPLRTDRARHGAPVAVLARLRAFETLQPLTELRYRAGGGALQAIEALHTQQRRRSLFGQPGVVGVLAGLAERGAAGAYPPGSRLQREQRVWARLRYEQVRWSAELSYLRSRIRVGAPGSLSPRAGFVFDAVYDPLLAEVPDADARRKTTRRDIALTLRGRLNPAAPPLTVSFYTARQASEYRRPGDTLAATVHRYGLQVEQPLRLGGFQPSVRLAAWHDRLKEANALVDNLGLTRSRLHAAVRDTLRLFGVDAVWESGVHAGAGTLSLGGMLYVTRSLGPLQLFAEAVRAGQPASWVAQHGYGAFVTPPSTTPDENVLWGRVGFDIAGRTFDAKVFGWATHTTDPLDFYVVATDTIAVKVAGTAFQQAGVAADLGWRRDAMRGVYATVQPAFRAFLNEANEAASPEQARAAAALPAWSAAGRLGARYLLFRGDLDLDFSLRGRFWSALRSRTLHPMTGLLVLPEASARTFGPNGTLDIVAVAGVRTATFFVAYENLLGGTVVQAGALTVPVYPLPTRRFRFGVYWPILN